jgi:hypothetical protein
MEKDDEFKKNQLQSLLWEVKNKTTANEARYFHVSTIENLITHFQRIKTDNDKNWVYESLVEYFEKCSEFLPPIDKETSNDLYHAYIDKLTDYYSNNLGFVMLINRAIIYFIYLIVILLCFVFFNLYVVVGVIFFINIQILKNYKKYKDKRVYAIFW